RKREEAQLSTALKKEIEDVLKAQERKDAATEKRLDRLTKELEEARKARPETPRLEQKKSEPDSPKGSAPAIKRDERGNPYLVPPMPQDSETSGHVNIPPAQQGEVSQPRERHWTELNEPIDLTGEEQPRSNDLVGSKVSPRSSKTKVNEGSYLPMGSFN